MAFHAPTQRHYHLPRIHLSTRTATNAAWTALASVATVLVVLSSQHVAPIAQTFWHGFEFLAIVLVGFSALVLSFLAPFFVH
jgi:hypothetical protein